NVELRITDRLRIDALGVRLDRAAKSLRIVGVDKGGGYAELRKCHGELRIGAAIERARGDDVVAVLRQCEQGEHLGRHAGRRGQACAAAFERGDPLLERGDRRIRDPRIDVAERLQVKEARRVIGAVEDEGRRLVDRQRPRAGRGVRDMPGVQAKRVEAEFVISHRNRSKRHVPGTTVTGAPRASSSYRAAADFHPGRLAETMPVLTPAQLRPPRMRACSIFTHRFITTSSPASSAILAARSLRMPSCIQSTLAPIATASRAIGGMSSDLRKQSTMSTWFGMSRSVG